MNAITLKEVFPLIKENKMWVGATSFNKDGMLFFHPKKLTQQKRSSAKEQLMV
jgi:hypothetical protein